MGTWVTAQPLFSGYIYIPLSSRPVLNVPLPENHLPLPARQYRMLFKLAPLTLCFSINLGGYLDYPPSLCLLFSPQVLQGHHLFETFAMLQLPRIPEQCLAAHGKHRNSVITSLPSAPIILHSHPLLAPAASSTAFHPLKPPIMLAPLPFAELSALPCCPSETSFLPGAGPDPWLEFSKCLWS